jgi:hypothetical protein
VKITIGEWRTRGGRKAIVAAENKEALSEVQFIGWVDGFGKSWNNAGRRDSLQFTPDDLIEPWTDPVPWDWSTTPQWINWIAMWSEGDWFMFDIEPAITNMGEWHNHGSSCHLIPKTHSPKWSGDWRESKTMRPGFNGGAK